MRFAEIDNIIGLISPDSLVFGGGATLEVPSLVSLLI